MKSIKEKRKCPICKKEYIVVGHISLGLFFMIDKNPCYVYPFCSKECFETAKARGLWK